MDIAEQNHEDWKKFIQINVYGRTLGELQENGVDLKHLLKEIGCSKYYITEQSMYSGDSDSGMDSSFEDTIPIFSNTVATTKFPRCSTPVASKFYSKMTLCPSKIISRISENFDDLNLDTNVFEDENKEFLTQNNITDDENVIRILIVNMIEEVEKNADETIDELLQNRTEDAEVEMEQLDNDTTKNVEKPIKEREIARLEKSNKLKRASSEIKKGRKKAIRVRRSNTAHPLLAKDTIKPYSVQTPTPKISYDSRQMSTSSEKIYCDLIPVSSDAENSRKVKKDFYAMPTGTIEDSVLYIQEKGSEEIEPNATLKTEDFENHAEWADALDSFEHSTAENRTIAMSSGFEMENDVENTIDTIKVEETAAHPILVRNSECSPVEKPKTKKTVSFAVQDVPDIQAMTPAEYKKHINVIRSIKCQFPKCKKVYKWKIKYGKMRLVDHALSHSDSQVISCQLCDKTTKTVRQMRYHNQKDHGNNRIAGYGMKRLPVDENEVKKIWRICFEQHIPIIGEASTRANHVRLTRKASEPKDGVESSEPDDSDRDEENIPHQTINLDDF